MRSPELLETIEEQGILQSEESNEYQLTDDIQALIQKKKAVLREHINDDSRYPIDGNDVVITRENIDFYANYIALDRRLTSDSSDRLAKFSLILSWFQRGMPPTEETPERFLPVYADQLPVILELYSPAIVYIWRHNCDPCELVKSDLNEIFEDGDQDQIGLFSIYGPDHSQFLQDTYNIVGGPTTLFIVNGRVDSRLQGAHEPQLIRREIETIRSRDE